MERLKDALERILYRRPTLRAFWILSLWPEVVPERIKKNTEPLKVKGGTLFVAAKSAAWANELTMLKTKLIARLNQAIGEEVVKDIRFQGVSYAQED